MASKMRNYVEHQRRHLSSEEFTAWVASDLKVQAWIKKQEGLSTAEKRLEDIHRDLLKKAIGPGLQKASDFLAGIERAEAGGLSKTGILRQSIGSSKLRLYPARFCGYIASGPRRGYGRAVQVQVSAQGRISVKRLSKKQTLIMTATRKQVPTEYAWFLVHGHKAVRPTKKHALMTAAMRFFSHAKAAPPKDFMAPARAQEGQAVAIATGEINNNLQTMLTD
jgi:hypothetical protein